MSWSSNLICSFAEEISSCCRACVRIEVVRSATFCIEDAFLVAGRVCRTTITDQLFFTQKCFPCGRASVRNDNNRPGAEKLNLFNQSGVRLSNSSSLESCVLEVRLLKSLPWSDVSLYSQVASFFPLLFLMLRAFVLESQE